VNAHTHNYNFILCMYVLCRDTISYSTLIFDRYLVLITATTDLTKKAGIFVSSQFFPSILPSPQS
jgi:hypothetical protein